jgi:hypothetical protein
MRRIGATKIGALCALTAALGAALGGLASAEVGQKDNIRVTFSGSIAPVKLPRVGTAPIGVQLGGKIKTTDPSMPPILDRIILDINRNGHIQSKGLGLCSLAKLNSVAAATAKKQCADALIGRGNVTTRVSLPGQGAFASNGSLLAFNGHYKGGEAIFAQVSQSAPLRSTYVIVFEVKKRSGTFGATLIGTLPPIASEYGYISAFNMNLRRTYTYKGKKMSYASSGCPAAKGFPGASFPLARASYEFESGTKITSTLNRECKVRG